MDEPPEGTRWRDPFAGEPPTDPTRTLQVIAAGLPRTGTISLTLALSWALHGDVCHGGSACLRGKERKETNLLEKRWGPVLNRGFQISSKDGQKSSTQEKAFPRRKWMIR